MSYPEPRYDGDTGLTEATFRPAGHQPEVTYASGGTAHYLATGELTRRPVRALPLGDGRDARWPGPHFHRTISESFFVLAGTVQLYDGIRWTAATAGDFLFVPEGGIHAFRNDDGPASMLILFAPARRARTTSRRSPGSAGGWS